MRMRALLPAFAVLVLAACGEQQTAQAPADPPTAPPRETAAAPPAPATPSPPSATAAAPAPAATPSTTGAVSPAPPAGTSQTAAAPGAAGLQPFQGRAYAAGPLSLQLNADNTFVMSEIDGSRKVQGRYAFRDGELTLSDPSGDIGPAQFPMRCRFEGQGGTEFRLVDTSGSCARFKDLTFRPAAG
jgi:hypothetical protein